MSVPIRRMTAFFKASVFLLVLVMGSIVIPSQAAAQTSYRVDDSATTTSQLVITMRWLTPSQAGGAQNLVQGQLQVQARLNVQPWLGRPSARIYMGLGPSAVPSLVVSWQTQGRFINGTLRQTSNTSSRVLVYQGPINQARLEEVLLLTFTADGRSYSQSQNLQFFFDIEP